MIEEHERTNASLYDLSKLYDLQSDWLDLNKRDYSSKGQGSRKGRSCDNIIDIHGKITNSYTTIVIQLHMFISLYLLLLLLLLKICMIQIFVSLAYICIR